MNIPALSQLVRPICSRTNAACTATMQPDRSACHGNFFTIWLLALFCRLHWPYLLPVTQVADTRAQGIAPRGIVFINPGNPTGQCLSYDNLAELIKFAHEEKLVLMADEVYQENIYQVC